MLTVQQLVYASIVLLKWGSVILNCVNPSERENGYQETFSSDDETEQEKKLRLTKKYLAQIEDEGKIFINIYF